MAKTGPLGKAEKFYVEKNCDEKSASEIAKELDRSIESIEKHANRFKSMRTKAGGQMARQEGVVVMTEGASQMAGDFYKVNRRDATSRKNCITTAVREDDDSKKS